MEENLLKGNFKVKKEVSLDKINENEASVSAKLKKMTLASLGGSMVYMERTDLTWDGDK
jgi:hypothetical protein